MLGWNGPRPDPWWGTECPARGVGLHHVHDVTSDLPITVCTACGGQSSRINATPPPIDVTARLEALGYPKAEGHDENTPVEPKMITGDGPQGVKWGPGRGELTKREEVHLVNVIEYRAWLAVNGGGEEE